MDPVAPSRESPDEAFLLELSTLATRHARKLMTRDAAADLAQDLVLDHLIKLRAGVRFDGITSLDAYVRNMVRRRWLNALRANKRAARREAEHASEMLESPRAWMSPERALEQRELAALLAQTLASLPHVCRRAFTMVSDAKTTYEVTATLLGVSPGVVNRHVIFAKHRFRCELQDYGIAAPTPKRRRHSARAAAP